MTTQQAQDVCRVALRLSATYLETELGNPKNPLDDLIYIILSGQTNEASYQTTFQALKARYPHWLELASAKVAAIAKVIKGGGLSKQKAMNIKRIIKKLISDWGRPTLAPLLTMSDDEAENYLQTLPGVGVKTARCVMMYALHREVFPADVHCLRIMERLGWLKVEGRRAASAADVAQELVPPHLRRSLHIDLVQHGRSVCTPRNPKCEECGLVDLCPTRGKIAPTPPKVVDLCCGAGGFSWGFMQAGFEIIAGIDNCPQALSTFSANMPGAKALRLDVTDKGVAEEIRKNLGGIFPDVVITGPPCQGFSRAGPRKPDDPRNGVLAASVRTAVKLRPKVIVIENVMNLRGPAFVSHLRRAMGVVRRAGYRFGYAILRSEAYGVPQTRRRIVIIAVRSKDRDTLIEVLDSLACRETVEGMTVQAAFDGLPTESEGSPRIHNHEKMVHSPKVIAKIEKIKHGGGPLSYRKLDLSKPARTLVCGHRALPCHPTSPRTITVREAARVQSFWDDFRFYGSRSCQMNQVANAVPTKLAMGIAAAVHDLIGSLEDIRSKHMICKVLQQIGYRPSQDKNLSRPSH